MTVDGKRIRSKAFKKKSLAHENSFSVTSIIPTPPTSSSSECSNDSRSSLNSPLSLVPCLRLVSISDHPEKANEDVENKQMTIDLHENETSWYFWYCWSKLVAYQSLIEMNVDMYELNLYSLAHEISIKWLNQNGM